MTLVLRMRRAAAAARRTPLTTPTRLTRRAGAAIPPRTIKMIGKLNDIIVIMIPDGFSKDPAFCRTKFDQTVVSESKNESLLNLLK